MSAPKLTAKQARDLASYLEQDHYRDLQRCFCQPGMTGTFDCALCAGRNHVALARQLAAALDRIEELEAQLVAHDKALLSEGSERERFAAWMERRASDYQTDPAGPRDHSPGTVETWDRNMGAHHALMAAAEALRRLKT